MLLIIQFKSILFEKYVFYKFKNNLCMRNLNSKQKSIFIVWLCTATDLEGKGKRGGGLTINILRRHGKKKNNNTIFQIIH